MDTVFTFILTVPDKKVTGRMIFQTAKVRRAGMMVADTKEDTKMVTEQDAEKNTEKDTEKVTEKDTERGTEQRVEKDAENETEKDSTFRSFCIQGIGIPEHSSISERVTRVFILSSMGLFLNLGEIERSEGNRDPPPRFRSLQVSQTESVTVEGAPP